MAETPEHRLKRLRMRSMRRGIKEMDLILTRFSELTLEKLSATELDEYEALLNENDQDLYLWVSGQAAAPSHLHRILSKIAAGLSGN